MASMIALLTAALRYPDIKRFVLWLAVCGGAAALAIDEMFEIHEQTVYIFGEDDYIKIVMMLVAVAGLYLLYTIEKPSKKVIQFFAVGFMLHLCYLTVDFGDGDFFQLPISDDVSHWAEEIFEMLAIQTYFAGLIVFYMTQAQTSESLVAAEKKDFVLNSKKQPA